MQSTKRESPPRQMSVDFLDAERQHSPPDFRPAWASAGANRSGCVKTRPVGGRRLLPPTGLRAAPEPAIRPPSSPTSAGVVQPHWDQPINPPPLDLVGRPRPLIFAATSRAGARTRDGGGALGLLPPGHPCGSGGFSHTGSADRDRPALDLVRWPGPLIFAPISRAGARTRR